MIKSMTGFGREHKVLNGREISAEIKSVNHKYFELSCRLPRSCSFLEPKLKAYVKERVGRGKIELSVSVCNIDVSDTVVRINRNVAENYIRAIRDAAPEFGLEDNLCATDLFRMPEVFTVIKDETDEEALLNDVLEVVSAAVDKFIEMRTVEGAALKQDVLEKATNIEKMVGEIEVYSPESTEKYRRKLFDKMQEVLGGYQVDTQRILLEAGIFSEKTAVDEETVRLRSHLEQLREMVDSEQPIGRKIDFLIQEINRETNTIGSKAADIRITRLVVEMKSEIEKIREQIQNIE